MGSFYEDDEGSNVDVPPAQAAPPAAAADKSPSSKPAKPQSRYITICILHSVIYRPADNV